MKKERDAGLRASELVEPRNGTLDINDIQKIIPHRHPFLFVDKLIEVEKGKRAVGIKKITGNEEFFKGHFPGNPVMPGVLVIEALAQVGGILMFIKEENMGRAAYFVGLDSIRFRKAVIPGDELRLEVDIVKIKSRIARLHGVAKLGSEMVAEADILFGFAAKA